MIKIYNSHLSNKTDQLPWTYIFSRGFKETLIKLLTFMVRQAHHERNQYITVRPEPVEGLNQNFPKVRFLSIELLALPRDVQ